MLNLVNLLNTLLITTGLATASPVCDTEKTPKAKPLYQNSSSQTSSNPYVNTYEIELTPNNLISSIGIATINNVNDTTYSSYNTATDDEYRYTLTNNTNYLNVIGNIYQTEIESSQTHQSSVLQVQNYWNVRNNLDNLWQDTSRFVYVLKITPYNYNIDTTTTVNLNLSLENPTNLWNTSGSGDVWQLYINNMYLYQTIYTATGSNWDTFLGRQLTEQTGRNIIEEIKDVDNGFYYTNKTTLIESVEAPDPNRLNTMTTTLSIEIAPKQDNYVVIDIVPCALAYKENDDTLWENKNVLIGIGNYSGSIMWPGNTYISGTNIIPNGSYEVIDIPGLMWEILTMPFAFVSQAFNLTLFPGTPFQINIANLFLSVLAIFVFIFLVSLIVKLAGSAV